MSRTVQVDTVLLKVASRCNINCSYCYVYNMGDDGWRDMPAVMSQDTIDEVCAALAELKGDQDRCFAVVLHGGEPLMLGVRRLKHLLEALRRALPTSDVPVSLQTNGTLITNGILDVCADNKVSLSVSLDGPTIVNDKFRISKRGGGTHDDAVQGIRLLREHSDSSTLFSGLLAVINPWSSPREVFYYLKGLGTPSIDFLYRDGNHSAMPFGKQSFSTVEYGRWLEQVLDVYLADSDPPRVRFLDDLIKLCLGGHGIKEGSGDTQYGIAVIDTDGSVTKNDTLKSTSNGADRLSGKWTVHTHSLTQVFSSNDFQNYSASQRPTATACCNCPELRVCGGGMQLHRWHERNGFDNVSVYCSDQKYLIASIRRRLSQMGIAA